MTRDELFARLPQTCPSCGATAIRETWDADLNYLPIGACEPSPHATRTYRCEARLEVQFWPILDNRVGVHVKEGCPEPIRKALDAVVLAE